MVGVFFRAGLNVGLSQTERSVRVTAYNSDREQYGQAFDPEGSHEYKKMFGFGSLGTACFLA
jgi:hypothetical protein